MDSISNALGEVRSSLVTSTDGYATTKSFATGVFNIGVIVSAVQYLYVAKEDPIDSTARTAVVILSCTNLGLNILAMVLAFGLGFTKIKPPRGAAFAAELEAAVASANAHNRRNRAANVAKLKKTIRAMGQRYNMPGFVHAAAKASSNKTVRAVAQAAKAQAVASGDKITGWAVLANVLLAFVLLLAAVMTPLLQYFDGQRQAYDSIHPASMAHPAPAVPGAPM